MTLNGSDAYLSVHDDSPFVIVFGGTQCGKSRFIERAYAEPCQDDIDWYVDIFLIVIRNVLAKTKVWEATFKHSAKFPSPEMMNEIYLMLF